jgi:acyl-CoA thioesterase FadM
MNPAYPYPVVVDADTDSSTLVPDKTTGRMAPKRYELRAKAPAAVDPKGVVYAVPYVAVQDRYATRYIACAMFSHEGNVRRNYTVAKQVDYAYTVTTDDLTTEIRASLLTEDGTNLIWEVA